MKKSYINIVKEIEKMRADGLDDDTIKYALQAKYNESNIEHIYTQAEWERDDIMDDDGKTRAGKKPLKVQIFIGALAGLVVVLFVILIAGLATAGGSGYSSGNTSSNKYEPSKRDAYYISQEFLKKTLKAPSTASFPRYQEGKYVKELDDDEYLITAYVDAENSFGAKIRSTYMSQVKYLYGETWQNLGTYLIE